MSQASQLCMTPPCPVPWLRAPAKATLLHAVAERKSVLMLDYDGTLAPFHRDRLRAVPYQGVRERLRTLCSLTATRLVLITGRPAQELNGLIALETPVEIWGSHGREHLSVTGEHQLTALSREQNEALEAVEAALGSGEARKAVERKPASLAIHWRALASDQRQTLEHNVENLYQKYAAPAGLHKLSFDGGIEIRSADIHKGTVVDQILAQSPDAPAAYLGDDTTDEDAFRALDERGAGILVGAQPRVSTAHYWLRPPEELLIFLDDWITAARRNPQ